MSNFFGSKMDNFDLKKIKKKRELKPGNAGPLQKLQNLIAEAFFENKSGI